MRQGISFEIEVSEGVEWIPCPDPRCHKGYLEECELCGEDVEECECSTDEYHFCPTCMGQGGFDV